MNTKSMNAQVKTSGGEEEMSDPRKSLVAIC